MKPSVNPSKDGKIQFSDGMPFLANEDETLAWLHIQERKVVGANQVFLNLLGITAENLLGESLDWPKFSGTGPHEWKVTTKAGKTVWILVGGEDPTFYALDISKQKLKEEGLRQEVEALTQTTKELQEFASVACHDLKSPLQRITSFIQLINSEYSDKLGADAKEYIGYVVDGAKSMSRLVEDLHTYTTIGQSEEPSGLQSGESILLGAMKKLKREIQTSKAKITYDSLPTIYGNPGELEMLFEALLSNSIRYVKDQTPEIHVSAKREGSGWTISVRDNGIGIEKQYQQQIFTIFERLHSNAVYPGSGIGLATAQKIVLQHRGKLGVDSEPGKGSTFFFTLPDSATDSKNLLQ